MLTKQTMQKNSLEISAGAFPPSVQLKQFNDKQWEAFIESCCLLDNGIRGKYEFVKGFGGPGDAGRDVEARLVTDLLIDQWDLYQAKHYQHPLAPSDIFPELAKFFWHLGLGTFPRPRYYFICAPLNTGPELHDLLAKPSEFKKKFLDDWDLGKTGLKGKQKWRTAEALAQVTSFDFKNIREVLVRELIELHATDQTNHFKTFHITPVRGDDPLAPDKPAKEEENYINELVKAYAEDVGKPMNLDEIAAISIYSEHLIDCRNEFYCAEGLKRFSRDIYPNEFERLLAMILQGIRSTVNHPKHKNGLDRLNAAVTQVSTLALNDSKLHPRMRPGDLPGSCHHLVNERKLKWTK
jgi:hypothetical protein